MKVVIGSSIEEKESGWLLTNIDKLDVSKETDWISLLGSKKLKNLFSEHVWEHIPRDLIGISNTLCYKYLCVGGKLRIAVPDGNHPDAEYINNVKPNGSGIGSHDHKILYTYDILKEELELVGFKVFLIEYWDENGEFHKKEWDSKDGHVRRSAEFDKRNEYVSLSYTSLIIDAIKI